MTIQFPTVDWTTLIPNLVGLFFNAIGTWLNTELQRIVAAIWSSGANVFGQTPLDMVWQLGPIQTSLTDLATGAHAVLLFALVLLGIRGILGAIVPGQPDMLEEGVNGILGAIVLTALFPIMVPKIITLFNQAATAVALGSMGPLLTNGFFDSNPFIAALSLVVLLFFAFRLLKKAIWRVGFLAVMLPVGFASMLLYAIPQLRWIAGWWCRVWGGMLIAQLPSVLALFIGVQLATSNGGSLAGFVYSMAFMQLATDLYDLIPFGMVRGGSSPFGALGSTLALARLGGGLAGALGGAAVAETAATSAVAPHRQAPFVYSY